PVLAEAQAPHHPPQGQKQQAGASGKPPAGRGVKPGGHSPSSSRSDSRRGFRPDRAKGCLYPAPRALSTRFRDTRCAVRADTRGGIGYDRAPCPNRSGTEEEGSMPRMTWWTALGALLALGSVVQAATEPWIGTRAENPYMDDRRGEMERKIERKLLDPI